MRILWTLLACTLILPPLAAQDWAKTKVEKSPRHLEYVKVKAGNREVNCFIAFPEVKTKATAVVVIHEIFGLSDWVRLLTDDLAEEGYIAIAPDLLTGMGPNGGGSKELGNDVRRAIMELKPEQVTADLNGCVEYCKKLDACNGKIAVCGFCWGGGQTFRFANHNSEVKAFFPFYGNAPATAKDTANIKAPIYGSFAGNDNRINAGLPAAEQLLKARSLKYEFVTFESGGHGFMRDGEDPTVPEDKRKKAREGNIEARAAAWKRFMELLKKV